MGSTSTNDNGSWPDTRLGMHYLAEFTGCPAESIATVNSIERLFIDALERNGATVLGHTTHQFEPFGATIVVLLAESHASLHTWPENNSVCIDMFSCSPALNAEKALRELGDELAASKRNFNTIERAVPE